MPGYVVAVVDDLFFLAKIDGTARALGVPLRTVRRFEELAASAQADAPALILLDLHLAGADPLEIIRRIRADDRLKAAPLTAFASHVQVKLIESARSAGCPNVIPRSELARDLAAILSRAGGDARAAAPSPDP
jgi:CheY-like chemotaxis protein